ncbi:MAG: DNA repair protein rad16 [Chrysothrix sp. TS-e1954]|nr:MAG: DNA repair protein rad16 [Chrysothrix sp. TS-e1954]
MAPRGRLRHSLHLDSDDSDSVPLKSKVKESIASHSKTPAPRRALRDDKVFTGVMIPAKRDSLRSLKLKRESTSSLSSPAPSFDDSLSRYETPGTSASVTPAEPAESTKGKGKGRASRSTNRTSDEDLAQKLQQEEYELSDAEPARKRSKLGRNSSSKNSRLDESSYNMSPDPTRLSEGSRLAYAVTGSVEDIRAAKQSQSKNPNAARGFLEPVGHFEHGFESTAARPKRKAGNNAQQAIKLHSDELAEISSGLSDAIDSADEFRSDSDEFESALESAAEAVASDEDDEDDMPIASRRPAVPARTPARASTRASRGRGSRRGRGREPRAVRERRKLEKSHPEIKTMWKDLEKTPLIKAEQAPQPDSITRQLKCFQLEGLNWMMKQEQTKWKGGLLGDEMGMGKTIQAVSLIMSDYPAKQPTLVVVPPVALMQWTNEINEYTNGKLRILLYHGTNSQAKKLSVKQLKTYDVIMISYSGLESIYRKEVKGWTRGDVIVKEESPIHAIHFHRLILDEAHSIKARTTGVSKACYALKGSYKWCLSGTPVQNRIAEFFSLMRFLEVTPFANYFCKSCPCSSLHWAMDKSYRCTQCKHRSLDHVSVFNQEIINPITSAEAEDQVRKDAFAKLRKITDHVMLRRMKRDHTASMELPPKETIIHREFFGPEEQDFAASIMGNITRKFDTYVSHGVMLNNYANIFGLIMQMRQVADHPDLLLKKVTPEGGNVNVLVCEICDEAAEDAIRSQCKHEFCRACVTEYIHACEGNGGTPDCPRCHIALSIDLEQPEIEQDTEHVKTTSIINRIKMEGWTSSTKIEMLVYDLWKQRNPKRTTKSIVFSQFTSMLQLIEWRLRRAGFNTVMLDGSMSPVQRQRSIEHFMNNTDCEVFLVSLKAGGVALNLVEASRVYVVDPWWNPAAEWQASDRCHRIGQRRPCVITRLCVEDSIESRIVMLQEKKAHMIHGTVNNDDVSMEKLTPQDMQFLFRG